MALTERRTGQRFYIGFGIFVILLSFAGFAPSLIDQSRAIRAAHDAAAGARCDRAPAPAFKVASWLLE